MVVFGQGGCKRARWLYLGKMVVFGHFFSLFGQKRLCSGIVVVFEQSGYIREKWLFSGKSGSIWAKRFYSGKVVVFGQK